MFVATCKSKAVVFFFVGNGMLDFIEKKRHNAAHSVIRQVLTAATVLHYHSDTP